MDTQLIEALARIQLLLEQILKELHEGRKWSEQATKDSARESQKIEDEFKKLINGVNTSLIPQNKSEVKYDG